MSDYDSHPLYKQTQTCSPRVSVLWSAEGKFANKQRQILFIADVIKNLKMLLDGMLVTFIALSIKVKLYPQAFARKAGTLSENQKNFKRQFHDGDNKGFFFTL